MKWIYLSPHLDDVVLSCGGRVFEQVQAGRQVEIWTICAGDPPQEPFSTLVEELHGRWKTGPQAQAARRSEDVEACRILGAASRHFDLPDCIYRRLPGSGQQVVTTNAALFQPLLAGESYLVDWLHAELIKTLPVRVVLVSPMTLGSHMDHHLVRMAAEKLGRPLWYYPDYPYVTRQPAELAAVLGHGWRRTCSVQVTQSGLHAWQAAVAAYSSQISSFWGGLDELCAAIEEYWRNNGGKSILWRFAREK